MPTEISDTTIRKAQKRMAERVASGPHAVAVRYDRRVSRIMVSLSNGLELAFPPHLAEGLADAKPADVRTGAKAAGHEKKPRRSGRSLRPP